MTRTACLLVLTALAACSAAPAPQPSPVLPLLDCRDPATRHRLSEGDTYRDLAAAHASAVAGWSDCWGAVRAARAAEEKPQTI